MPYCTGDIYSGRHTAVYGNKTVYHEGHLNVAKVLEVLVAQTSLAQARDVVFFGESAGALGVLLNLNQVDAVTPKAERRLALLDSPGLHFKDDVWQRFDATYLDGIRQGLLDNHMVFDTSSGILAPQLLNYCAGFPNWKIGVVQATKDIVMSVGFGNLTPDQHAARVNGPTGIVQQLANPNDNCVSWVPNKMRHVYSVDPKGWVDQTEDGVTDETFVNELYASRLEDPHLSHH